MTTTQTIVREHEADLVVQEAGTVADGVVALTLADPNGAELPPWTPGAHIDFVLTDDLVRQYSLCSSPSKPNVWRVGVLRDPNSRGGSEQGAYRPDCRLDNSCSRTAQPLSVGREQSVPLCRRRYRDHANAAHDRGGECCWLGLAAALRRPRTRVYGIPRRTRPYGGRVTIVPQDEQGMFDLESVLGTPQPDTLVYCCGPEGLLHAVEKFCEKWPPGTLHIERFAAKPQEPTTEADSSFELVLQRSGLTVQVPPDKSVLTVIREAGVSVLASCLEGICGTCETEVIDGDVDHRDSVLNEEERASNEYMMVCVSRCRSPRLTLDL